MLDLTCMLAHTNNINHLAYYIPVTIIS